MRIHVESIADRGVSQKERLHLTVLADTNLVYYVVLATKWILTPIKGLSSRPYQTFWFTNQLVKAGDHIVLSTGTGIQSSQVRPDQKTNHFFYWGLPYALWNLPEDCAVVLEVSSWESTPFT